MSNEIKFTINIGGNAYTGIAELDEAMQNLNISAKNTSDVFNTLSGFSFKFDNISKTFQSLSNTISSINQPGISLDSSLSDLSAVAGVTGKGLKEIEGYARQTAKAFGLDAAQAVESYKLILSQLSPELAKNPAAMNEMGNAISTLSKTMGGNATAAAEVLTTAMNQYGVSLADPIEASRKMAEMMNVMAAAGKEGSAELPTIKLAIEQCGMAAKAAGVSFEETNAAIQVLDKAGKKGAEGGVALRNTMSILAQGRFLPKDIQEELQAAGIDIVKLGDKSMSLSERLRLLKPVMSDTALFTKLFGRENANAAMALVQGTSEIDRYRDAITGTNTAYEQAGIIMENYAEKQARINAKFNDLKISVFNLAGDFGIWVDVVTKSLVPISQLMPLVMTTAKLVGSLRNNIVGAGGVLPFLRAQLNKTFGNTIRAAIVATTLKINILKMSIASAGGMFGFLKTVAVNAIRAISTAIMNIPVIGWILAAIAAIIALFKLLWDKCEGFRRLVFGIWEAIKAIGSMIAGLFSTLFNKIKQIASNIYGFITGLFKDLWSWITGVFSKFGDWIVGVLQPVWNWFSGLFAWIGGVFSKVGAWFAKVMKPVTDWFGNLWNTVKSIFGRIVEFMGKIFNPIIKLWNALTGKVTDAYETGAEKGSESFNKNKTDDNQIEKAHIPGVSPDGTSGDDVNIANSVVPSAANAIASGGTRNTQVTINLGKMADINFNGNVHDNIENLRSQLEEVLLRVLYSAQNAGG
jgi:TP901 family phage tail tape measure protein